MDAPLFYTPLAENLKILFYLLLALMICWAFIRKKYYHDARWMGWIHAAVLLHFLTGAFYSGIRMLQMDPLNHMMIRRFFAWEAWFNFACAAFYFLAILFLQELKTKNRTITGKT